MANGYFKAGRVKDEAVFHLFFRQLPFAGGYAILAGLEAVVDFVQHFHFESHEIDYLTSLVGVDGTPLFDPNFLEYLRDLRLSVNIDAIPEGTVVFANEPLLRVQGRLIEAQLLETTLLNLINFPTLIATKAARICAAAGSAPVMEFGLRRAQGVDGALAASRAAYIGGCSGTSNVLAGMQFGIPLKGTHAHSWVMSFDDELEAFEVYADTMPNNCLFLVDTYDSLEGVKNAIVVGHRLRERGQKFLGIRLDSGDLAWLSLKARALLDAAGFEDAVIVGSNDLDEHIIESLVHQGTAIAAWGVGTKLVTAYDQPALGGVYKLSMIARKGGPLTPRIKISEHTSKVTNPGIQQVRRFSHQGKFVADAIYDEMYGIDEVVTIVDPLDPVRQRQLSNSFTSEELLEPVIRRGKPSRQCPSLEQIRARCRSQLDSLDTTVKRLHFPHEYPVGLTEELYTKRLELITAARSRS